MTGKAIARRIGCGILALIPVLSLARPALVQAQDVESLKAGVVKIVTHVEEKRRVGTGFIVRLEPRAAYILTASHVIEGDPEPPQVTFQTAPTRSFAAKVVGMEGGDPTGLAALVVEGELPDGLRALAIDETEAKSGDPVTVVGFPLLLGTPWTVVEGQISGFKGRALAFQAPIEEGNSGGPLLKNGKVVGVITEKRQAFGSAVNALIAEVTLKGWGVEAKAESEAPVSISGMLSNSGWIISFSFLDDPREILYKIGSGGTFKSTGMSGNRSPETGLPRPEESIVLTADQARSKVTIYVKYKDQRGRERGPFELEFDPKGERLRQAKELLNATLQNDWVSFRYYAGKLTVYFTTLLEYRDSLKAVRYSADKQTLSQHFPLTEWTEAGTTPRIESDTAIYVDVPLATEYVAVKLQYVDGTESDLKIFRKPKGMASDEGVDELKRLLAKDPAAAKAKLSDGTTLLHKAADEGQVGAAKLLLASGAAVDARDQHGRTALHYAADRGQEGHSAVAAVLLAHGADVNAQDKDGDDPLHLAARSGSKGFADLLIAYKADVNAINKRNETPLHVADSKEVVEVLLARHANLEALDDSKETPLYHAVSSDRKDLAETLIAHGAHTNVRSTYEVTPLHVAAERGHGDIVRFLLGKGADANAADDNGKTPLHVAAEHGHADIVAILTAARVNVDARDNFEKQTLLHLAVKGRYLDVVNALVAGKADVNAKDRDGKTPLDLAEAEKANDIVRALRGGRAKPGQ